MKSWLVALVLLGMVSGPVQRAAADTDESMDGGEWHVSAPSLALVVGNGMVLTLADGSTFLGVLGAAAGTITLLLGALYVEPVVITAGAASLATGVLSARRASKHRMTDSLSIDPTISRDSYGAAITIRF
jgi:hypothetical protein